MAIDKSLDSARVTPIVETRGRTMFAAIALMRPRLIESAVHAVPDRLFPSPKPWIHGFGLVATDNDSGCIFQRLEFKRLVRVRVSFTTERAGLALLRFCR